MTISYQPGFNDFLTSEFETNRQKKKNTQRKSQHRTVRIRTASHPEGEIPECALLLQVLAQHTARLREVGRLLQRPMAGKPPGFRKFRRTRHTRTLKKNIQTHRY